jgi:hypothetical protein
MEHATATSRTLDGLAVDGVVGLLLVTSILPL